jgi:hypothetical protein
VRKITQSIGAGAESCTQVRAQNGNGRVKSAKFEFYIFSEIFLATGGGGRQKNFLRKKFFRTQVRRICQEI